MTVQLQATIDRQREEIQALQEESEFFNIQTLKVEQENKELRAKLKEYDEDGLVAENIALAASNMELQAENERVRNIVMNSEVMKLSIERDSLKLEVERLERQLAMRRNHICGEPTQNGIDEIDLITGKIK